MKRTYISPKASVVNLCLSASILEEGAGIGNASLGADGTDMQAKRFNSWDSFEEENEPSIKQSNAWE